MLLSKLDQRCEACICSHPDRAKRDVEGWGLETEKSYLWADIWKNKDPSLGVCWSLSFSLSQHGSTFMLLLSLHRSVMDLLCVEYIIRQCLFHNRAGLIYQ